mmetsp:Transcript_27286/g.71926  ORF Transcript_27286/g.71926 Transcript_27286/m.71926 type:complete len:134 (-) Transcript_27286:307-708(-)
MHLWSCCCGVTPAYQASDAQVVAPVQAISEPLNLPRVVASREEHAHAQFEATLLLPDCEKIGLSIVRDRRKGVLLVKKLGSEGAALVWNREHPKQAIVEGCVILSVNGVEGDVDSMVTECSVAPELRLALRRP